MARQTIIWTALPNGYTDEGELRLSIVVSPRLTDPADSSEQFLGAETYRDWHDWPTSVSRARFELLVDGEPEPFRLRPEPPLDLDRGSALWARMFPRDLFVQPFAFKDMSAHELHDYPADAVISTLKRRYAELAARDGLDRPSLFGPRRTGLHGLLGDLGVRLGEHPGRKTPSVLANSLDLKLEHYGEPVGAVVGIDGRLDVGRSVGANSQRLLRALPARRPAQLGNVYSSDAHYAFALANRFYSRPELKRDDPRRAKVGPAPEQLKAEDLRYADPDHQPGKVEQPDIDFHGSIALLADAPSVLRSLGLIVDVVVRDGGRLRDRARGLVNGRLSARLRLQVRRELLGGPAVDTTPFTAFELIDDRFVTATRVPAEHRDGLMRLAEVGEPKPATDKGLPVPETYNLAQIDVDGAALKTLGTALALERHLKHAGASSNDAQALEKPGELSYTTSTEESVAVLRSGGIALLRNGRAEALANLAHAARLKNQALAQPALAQQPPAFDQAVLFIEDLLHGYRVDIQELPRPGSQRPGQWCSLCQRQVSYRLADDGLEFAQVVDEGYVKGASTSSAPPKTLQAAPANTPEDHYLHSAVFRWTGWSLVVPRPGRRIVARNEHGQIQEEQVADHDPDIDVLPRHSPLLSVAESLKGTLPRLRFGNRYRMRARVVDLAGNSLSLDDRSLAMDAQQTQAITYQRLEPIDPPALALKQRISEGESVERLVIRSDAGLSSNDYLAREAAYRDNDPKLSGFAYDSVNQRHLVPPKVAQLMAEQHGAFEHAFSGGTPAEIREAYETIVAKEAGTLYQGGAPVLRITPPKAGQIGSPELPLTETPPEGYRLEPGDYVIHTEEQLLTPYLPDPLAVAIAFRDLPGITRDTLQALDREAVGGDTLWWLDRRNSLYVRRVPDHHSERVQYVLVVPNAVDPARGWPEVQGCRIAIVEQPEELAIDPCDVHAELPPRLPEWDGERRLLRVFLRKGEVAPVRYASVLNERFREHLALPSWITEQQGAAAADLAVEQASVGCHWMLTPDRLMTLVHATQKPICKPVFEGLDIVREPGLTYADLAGRTQVRLHGRSTGKLEVLGEWIEWIDNGPGTPLGRRRMSAQLREVGIAQPPLDRDEPQRQVVFSELGNGDKPDQVPHYRHEFGDGKFRLLHYRLRASTRFREYLPLAITADPELLQQTGEVFAGSPLALPADYWNELPARNGEVATGLVNAGAALLNSGLAPAPGRIVPATVRPVTPRLDAVIPTFRWTESGNDAQFTCVRRGNGLRVYLHRPWFSSGDGELLGVVLPGVPLDLGWPFAELFERIEPFVSQWGSDPLFASTLPRARITPEAFPAGVITVQAPLAEAGDQVFTVVGHRVHFDALRDQWYADIEIEPGSSYTPFVRLALVRLQPRAVSGCELSPVVLAPFAQIAPLREIQVQAREERIHEIKVYGVAPARGPVGNDMEPFDFALWGALLNEKLLGSSRNRMEVTLQLQTSNFATDLDWLDASDVTPVSADVEARVDDVAPPARAFAAVVAERRDRLFVEAIQAPMLRLPIRRSDLLFHVRIALPPLARGSRARLVLREYERHLGDDQEVISSGTGNGVRLPKVAERLVFARELYVLGYQPEVGDEL
ncbi:MAG: hypothetical protein Q8M37_14025 [Nevskia sp.]|nr:hypothetical protein [Nevskia sp.]